MLYFINTQHKINIFLPFSGILASATVVEGRLLENTCADVTRMFQSIPCAQISFVRVLSCVSIIRFFVSPLTIHPDTCVPTSHKQVWKALIM